MKVCPAMNTNTEVSISVKTPIVCGSCRTINYRTTELTCKRCGSYFPMKSTAPIEPKRGVSRDSLVQLAVLGGTATVCGTTAAALTVVIASVF
jgi:hypothetical protein